MAFTCRNCRVEEVGRDQADFEFSLSTSYGPCESCHETAECVDK